MKAQSTVLIVDDQPTIRETIGMMLQKQDYRLEFASGGREALEKAAKLNPDLILLDVMMPEMDGFEVCRRLRAHPMLAQVPIVMVTALNDKGSWLKALDAGADDFINKPIDTAELRTRVKNITQLNRHRRLLAEQARFEWVIKNADDGYLMVDENGHITYANPQARHYLVMPNDDKPIQQDFWELAQGHYRAEPRDAWANWPEKPENDVPRYLVRPETATAQPFWLQVTNLNLPPGLGATQIIRLRNVSEQVISQRDIWRFHSAIFHKLRTPLAVVLNALEILGRHVQRLSPDEIGELSKRAFSGAQRLRSEMEDVLQYLKAPTLATSGNGFELAQLEPVVQKISAELALPAVTLSAQAMESLLWEILENAKKFHPNHTPAVRVFIFRSSTGEVTLWLGDDGRSLPPEQLAKVWIPYYQGEKQFTGEIAGMGLGLSMVATLVWSAGGSCRMYNRSGGPGVVVELILPLQE
jgi:two-component system cell cycle response regulator